MRDRNIWYFWPSYHSITAYRLEEVSEVIQKGQAHIENGNWAAFAIAYTAAPAFDPALQLRDPGYDWKAHVFLFDSAPEEYDLLESPPFTTRAPSFASKFEKESYARAFEAVRGHLAQGDTYQVNLTFPLESDAPRDPAALFSLLAGESPPPYAAYFHGPSGPILSLSPELFFERVDRTIWSRPMKGTRPRHANPDELLNNPKDRAENLMIVDMIRNDLGRIADSGTVRVPNLFRVEDHGTVWQMTSTVEAQSNASILDILRALFPCASVVGAPKIETTRIIAHTESWNRGLYTGAIGIGGPDFTQFNVAIRTIECQRGQARYGIGSGVVWDSQLDAEWQECLDKAAILKPYGDELRLLETLRWEPGTGYYFLEEHLARLVRSGCKNIYEVRKRLAEQSWTTSQRVRILVGNEVEVQAETLVQPFNNDPPSGATLSARKADVPVDSRNPWLRHKTTLRRIYNQPKQGADEILLVNEQGNPTEFTIGNLVIAHHGEFFTPPVDEGLLPGVYREVLLKEGRIIERVITFDDLKHADAIYRINSVRGWEQIILLTIPS